jgi:hypothetical protein
LQYFLIRLVDPMNLEFEPAGELVAATVAASEIEREGAAVAGTHAHAKCANCRTMLKGSFCHACGQRDHVHRSLLHLGEEFLHGLLHFDTKSWRTLPLLVAQPGKLTRDYIEGKRTRFVSPLALFLFMVFFMFFVVSGVNRKAMDELPGAITAATGGADQVARTANAGAAAARVKGGAQPEVDSAMAKVAAEEKALRHVAAGAAQVAATGRVAKGDNEVDTGWPKLDAAIKYALKNPEFTLYKLKNAASKYSFLLVPISLPFLWLMFFWKRGITMYDHAVFALYSLSFMALLVVVLALLKLAGLNSTVGWLAVLVPPIHMYLQLRGAYALSFGSALWRTGVLLGVTLTVVTLYLLLILMLSMG